MRHLLVAWSMAWLGTGCAASIPPERFQAQVMEAERWQREYQAERERTEGLASKLAAVESALEELAQERAEAEQARAEAEAARATAVDELARLETERHALEEHNAQLLARQRELAALHEELSDVWYESALERARRRTQPPLPGQSAPEATRPAP
jgi:chromosome segregation ATPase